MARHGCYRQFLISAMLENRSRSAQWSQSTEGKLELSDLGRDTPKLDAG
jgi:hypothetical protein